ncbi:hypothetical protein B566_EDAN001588 [Ephemera danica]|nr:hypothetical protein B566_EDAN001588 [Ephemera danica]
MAITEIVPLETLAIPWNLFGFIFLAVFSYHVLNREMKEIKHQQGIKHLKDKVVLITGASSGLGEAFAYVFHKAGCRLVLAARREDELCRVRDDLIRINPNCGFEVHKQIMDVNYFGHVVLTKALLPSMLERKTGHIVAISSILGQISVPHRASYAASKHALQAFCDSLRAEVAMMDADHAGGMAVEYVADIVLHGVHYSISRTFRQNN